MKSFSDTAKEIVSRWRVKRLVLQATSEPEDTRHMQRLRSFANGHNSHIAMRATEVALEVLNREAASVYPNEGSVLMASLIAESMDDLAIRKREQENLPKAVAQQSAIKLNHDTWFTHYRY